MQKILSLLPYAVYAVLAAYVVAWAVLLVRCARRRRFYPILGDDRRTRWFWLATFVFVNPFLTAMYFFFAHRRSPEAQKLRIGAVQIALTAAVVAIAGFFLNFPGLTHLWMTPFVGRGGDGPDESARFSAHAATIEARNNTSSTTVSSSSDNARLACRRVAVIAEGGHALDSLIGSALREVLAGMPFVEEAVLFTEGRFPPDGELRPDVFVLVAARNVRVTPVPYAVTLRAEIDVSAGSSPWRGTASYHDGRDPPVLDFHWEGTVRHESKTVGYESLRHGLAARNIAGEIGEGLGKAFTKWREKYGVPRDVPEGLYGAYRAAKLPEPLRKIGARRLCSYRGLLTHGETYWRLRVGKKGLAELLERLSKELEAGGWRELSCGKRNLRMEHGPARIHVYRPSERVRTGWVVNSGEASEPQTTLYVRLRERFGPEERRAALERLLAEPAPTDALLFFSRLFDDDQRLRMYNLLERRPWRSLPAQVQLIHHYLGRKEHDKAQAGIRRGRALLWGLWDAGPFQAKLDGLAKKLAEALGDEKAKKAAPPTAEDFRAAGFHEIDANTQAFELEVGPGQAALLLYEGEGERLRTLNLRVIRLESEPYRTPYVWEWVENHGRGSRSRATEAGRVGTDGKWSASHTWSLDRGMLVRTRVNPAPKKGRFTIAVWVDTRRAAAPRR